MFIIFVGLGRRRYRVLGRLFCFLKWMYDLSVIMLSFCLLFMLGRVSFSEVFKVFGIVSRFGWVVLWGFG